MTNFYTVGFECRMLIAIFVIWMNMTSALTADVTQLPKSDLKIGEIADGLSKYATSILSQESLLIEYRIVSSEDFTPSRYGKHDSGYHVICGKKGGQWYSWLEGSELPLRSKYDKICVLGKELYVEHHGKQLSIGGEPGSDMYLWWICLDNLWLDVYHLLPPFRRGDHKQFKRPFLPKAIEEAINNYLVRGMEKVDGADCVLVERPGVDRIWVDPAKGFVVRKREIYFNKTRPTQTLSEVVYNKDLVEAKTGVWIPKTQVVDFYPDPLYEDKSVWGKLTCRWTLRIDRFEFDTLKDSFFSVNVPANTYVTDHVRNLEYVSQNAGDTPFGEAIEFAKQAAKPRRISIFVWVNVAFACVAAAIIFGVRWRRGSEK
jgi:hypothetical protein